MNNKVFYQHPNLMRVLGMHETVMEVMVNVLGAEKSQVMLQGEFVSNLTPAHGWCPLPSDSSRGGHGEEQGDGTQPVLTVLTHFTGLLSLLPILFCSPAPSKMEFLRVPLRSLVCLVLCQKAVLKENRILITILALLSLEVHVFCLSQAPDDVDFLASTAIRGWGAPAAKGQGVPIGPTWAGSAPCPGPSQSQRGSKATERGCLPPILTGERCEGRTQEPHSPCSSFASF